MIKKKYVVPGLLCIVLAILSVKAFQNGNNRMLKIELVALYNSSGWGYDILVDHKIFIHQEYIPAIAGKKEFLTREDAVKTASLVIEKLKRKKPPTITREDLLALKIAL